MNEEEAQARSFPELTILCGVPDGRGLPHRRTLAVLLLVEGKVTEAGDPRSSERRASSGGELLELLLGTGHVEAGVRYRTGRCPKHGLVGVPETEVTAAFDRGKVAVLGKKIRGAVL